MLTKEEILTYIHDNLEKYYHEYEVEKIGLFGSYATGTQTEDSDIDLVVEMPSKYKKFFALKRDLELHFSKKIDIVIGKNIRPLINSEIQNEIIYA